MKIICKDRQGGKTTEIIKIAAEGFFYIVCIDHREALRVAEQAKNMKLDIPFPITFDDFIKGKYYRPGIKGFVVDNADILIQQIARGVSVEAVSFNDT